MFIALLITFVALVLAAVLRRPFMRRPVIEGSVAVLFIVVLIGAAWRISFPQITPDFDTWAELARYRRHDAAELIKQHRPLHYLVEYGFMRGAELVYPDLRVWRAGITIASLFTAFVVLIRMRRTFFRSPRIEYPLLACTGFVLSTGGSFLIDSWNDHMPLLPFYIGGLGWILRMKQDPAAARKWILSIFIVQSLLHSAEPWLWAIALIASFAPMARMGAPRRRIATMLLGIMAVVPVVLILLLPGGARGAGSYIGQYIQNNGLIEALKIYAYGFALGGVVPLRARILIPLLLVAVVCAVLYRRKLRFADIVLLVAFAAAIVFPMIYESANPERYWMLCALWPIIALRALRRTLAGARCGKTLRVIPAAVLSALFLAGVAASSAATLTALDEEHEYNHYGKQLQSVGTEEDALFLGADHRKGSFYLWVKYYFPGVVGVAENNSDVTSAVEELGAVYYNYGEPPEIDNLSFKPVLRRANDQATFTYRVTSAP